MLVWNLWHLIQWGGRDLWILKYLSLFFLLHLPCLVIVSILVSRNKTLKWLEGPDIYYCVVTGKRIRTSPKLPSSNGDYLWKCCASLWGFKERTRSGCSKLDISFNAALSSIFNFSNSWLNHLNNNIGRLSLTGELLLLLLLVNLKMKLYQLPPRYFPVHSFNLSSGY